jgi:hypothetical protein
LSFSSDFAFSPSSTVSDRVALARRLNHFVCVFTMNRERPRAIRIAWARALTAFTVRPRSAAMSMTEALEMTSCRSRSSSSEVHAFALNFFVSVSPGPGHLNPSNKPGRIALVYKIVSLRPLAAPIAFHLGAELVERHRAEHWYSLAENLESHPHGALQHSHPTSQGLDLCNRLRPAAWLRCGLTEFSDM